MPKLFQPDTQHIGYPAFIISTSAYGIPYPVKEKLASERQYSMLLKKKIKI